MDRSEFRQKRARLEKLIGGHDETTQRVGPPDFGPFDFVTAPTSDGLIDRDASAAHVETAERQSAQSGRQHSRVRVNAASVRNATRDGGRQQDGSPEKPRGSRECAVIGRRQHTDAVGRDRGRQSPQHFFAQRPACWFARHDKQKKKNGNKFRVLGGGGVGGGGDVTRKQVKGGESCCKKFLQKSSSDWAVTAGPLALHRRSSSVVISAILWPVRAARHAAMCRASMRHRVGSRSP